MSELKPCPFCGVEPDVFMDDDGWWYVTCLNMHCLIDSIQTAKFASKARAVTAWNTRYDPTCQDVSKPPNDLRFWSTPHFKCSECGNLHVSMEYVRYCPNCGARVVEGDV